ncbi:MAG: DUF4296 domain-containing protein [Sphingobacteriales bacterium]|nr:DUF4296 domain-containing protein [Sphingobacteriales bacterium]
MSDLLVDIHLAEAGTEHLPVSADSFDIYNHDLYFAILKKHGVSREKFVKSMNYYIEHPVLMEKVYEDVTSKLEVISNEKYD